MAITAVRALLACSTLVLAAGCAQRADTAADGDGDVPVVETTASPTLAEAPPGPCSSEVIAPPAATATTDPLPVDGGSRPEVAPHQAENNAWKQRRALTPAERDLGTEAAARMIPLLDDLCAKGDYTTEGTRRSLLDAGFPADLTVDQAPPAPGVAEYQPFVSYALLLGDRTCVLGNFRPGTITIRVDGPTREGSCVEPKSH